jgi:transcriptional regulator with XRE-family HTH domain
MRADRLKEAIIKKGLKNSFIADRLGVNVNTVWRWTAGQSEPSDKKKKMLSELLGVPISFFMENAEIDAKALDSDSPPQQNSLELNKIARLKNYPPKQVSLKDFVKAREASKKAGLFGCRDLKAAKEIMLATLEEIEKELKSRERNSDRKV